MRKVHRSIIALTGMLALGLSGCGSDTLPTDNPGSPATSATSAAVSAPSSATGAGELAAMLPAKIRSAGKIVIGTDPSYEPNEFLGPDGKTVQGMDVDLMNAVAAKFGVKAEFRPAGFDTIITGVQSGKYDLGVSSFTINDKRKQQVNMVSYFSAGTQWATKPGNPDKIDPGNACGKTVGVQKGTVQQEDDLPARQAACGKAGRAKINVVVRDRQDQVTSDLVTGKVQAMLADSPVVAYAVKKVVGKIEALGQIYDSAPYGIVVKKDQTQFAQAIAKAFQQIAADGTYKKVLATWNNTGGAVSTFAVNPDV